MACALLKSVAMLNRSLLVALASIGLGIAAVACGGRVDSGEGSGSTASQAKKGLAENEQPSPSSTSSTSGAPTTEPSCTYEYNSSSGGSSGASMPGAPQHYECQSVHHYTCGGGASEITIDCESTNGNWKEGTFSCNGNTYAFDCANGCTLDPEQYAQCNLPEPDEGGGWGSTSSTSGVGTSTSGWSSSSGSSGSTTSSSGG